uniref:Uncharacterized protein n=1 Tax=Haemonchus contortus TaxID=6289 RepID=A0A7I4YWN9_HAECO
MSSIELCPEELEKLLLDENTTAEQLASIKATLERLSRKVDNLAASEAQQQNRQGSEEGPSRKVVYEQLNAGDFDNVEYHVNFDPVAAAQARRDDRLEAEDQGLEPVNVEPQPQPRWVIPF